MKTVRIYALKNFLACDIFILKLLSATSMHVCMYTSTAHTSYKRTSSYSDAIQSQQ